MAPTHLNHADSQIAEIVNDIFQEVCGWNEIRIEDRYQFALSRLQSIFESACFETISVRPVNVVDVEPQLTMLFHAGSCDLDCSICGVVQDLDFEELSGISNVASGLD